MVNLNALFPIVRRYAPDAPKQMMMESLQRAFRNFCEDSGAYREKRLVSTVKGQSDYLLSLPALTHVETLLSARQKGEAKYLSLHLDSSTLPVSDTPNKPLNIAINDLNEVRFYPIPDDVYVFELDVHLRPDLDCKEMSENLYRKYGEAIAFGACSDLLMMPGQVWSNPNLAVVMEDRLMMKVNEAKTAQIDSDVQKVSWV